jgi:hypothetical protein
VLSGTAHEIIQIRKETKSETSKARRNYNKAVRKQNSGF